MPNLDSVDQYNTLKTFLSKLDIPNQRKRIVYSNIPWLLKNVKDKKVRQILKKCHKDGEGYFPGEDPIHHHKLDIKQKKCEVLALKYVEKGITIEYGAYDPRVYKVKVEFTPEEWVDILNVEGESLHICCGDISRVRDILFEVIRDDCMISAADLWEASGILKHHGCGRVEPPLSGLLVLWEEIKDDANVNPTIYPVDPTDLKDAVGILDDASSKLSWNFFVEKTHNPVPDFKFEAEQGKLYELSRILPAITTIYKFLEKAELPPVEGWAVCEGDEVAITKRGLAFFRTEEVAKEIYEVLNKKEQEQKRRKNRRKISYRVRRAKVTLRDGIQFLD